MDLGRARRIGSGLAAAASNCCSAVRRAAAAAVVVAASVAAMVLLFKLCRVSLAGSPSVCCHWPVRAMGAWQLLLVTVATQGGQPMLLAGATPVGLAACLKPVDASKQQELRPRGHRSVTII